MLSHKISLMYCMKKTCVHPGFYPGSIFNYFHSSVWEQVQTKSRAGSLNRTNATVPAGFNSSQQGGIRGTEHMRLFQTSRPLPVFFPVLPPCCLLLHLIQWRNFTRQVIKAPSHDARCVCSFSCWQPPSKNSPLSFSLPWEKRKPKQSWANCCVCLSLWLSSCLQKGSQGVFVPAFWRDLCYLVSVPLCAPCGGRFEELCDSKLRRSWDRRAAGDVQQREDARQGLGFIKTQPPRTGTTTQRAHVCVRDTAQRISLNLWYTSALIGISCHKVWLYYTCLENVTTLLHQALAPHYSICINVWETCYHPERTNSFLFSWIQT